MFCIFERENYLQCANYLPDFDVVITYKWPGGSTTQILQVTTLVSVKLRIDGAARLRAFFALINHFCSIAVDFLFDIFVNLLFNRSYMHRLHK